VWTWTAIDAETKVVPSWAVGRRDAFTARAFMLDLASRLAHRGQLTSDGNKVYLEALEGAFAADIDYAMLVKMYEGDAGKRATAEQRYSPAHCTGATKQPITGHPDRAYISTSYVERQNLTMRISMRRFTRLTKAFSKKLENHKAAVAFYFMWYNFARIHQTLRVTPAMEAGIRSCVVGRGNRGTCKLGDIDMRCKYGHEHPPEKVTAATWNPTNQPRPYHCRECREANKPDKIADH
jgi:IS1 family transposase